LEVKRAAEEKKERLISKYLPKCDWSPQRMADYKRQKRRLEAFFVQTGLVDDDHFRVDNLPTRGKKRHRKQKNKNKNERTN